jgi:hypothetical protein
MLEQQVRRIVTEIVRAAAPNPVRFYHLCWWEKGLRCLHVHHTTQARLRNSERGDGMVLSLVFPPDARGSDFDKVKLSVLTRTGLSLLGRKVGDTIDGCLKILAVPYQPEAAGDLDL